MLATSRNRTDRPRREFDVTTTTPLTVIRFEVIDMSYLAMQTENAVKFEVQSWVIKIEEKTKQN